MTSNKRIVIASRKSDLARVQAYSVGDALLKKHPQLDIQFHFRESLGDINLNDPLWKMPEKGVFTADLTEGLIAGKWDMVVHSWKDLPVETHPSTQVVATLPREDQRDLLLIPKDRLQSLQKLKASDRDLKILSSSPRREYNLTPFLKAHWPGGCNSLQFIPVRGNVPTRIQKLFKGDGDALILAKAALDRLLTAERDEFQSVRELLSDFLKKSDWMILPLSENPTAAAQGALAIEISRGNSELEKILQSIHEPECFASVQTERKLLQEAGGGCHQKLGISIESIEAGQVLSVRGDRPTRRELNPKISRRSPSTPVSAAHLPNLFERKMNSVPFPKSADGIYVSHPTAMPTDWSAEETNQKIIWTAGLSTWKALAEKGIWVHGTDDGLGERKPPIQHLTLNRSLRWVKLSHAEAPDQFELLATYQLVPKEVPASAFEGFTHYFWKSFSQFQRALMISPQIRTAHHSCGPGNTARRMREILGEESIHIFLNEAEWRHHFGIR